METEWTELYQINEAYVIADTIQNAIQIYQKHYLGGTTIKSVKYIESCLKEVSEK